MNNYRNYEVEDFVCDDFFIDWVLNPKTDNSVFWDNWQRVNPDKVKHIQHARAILLAIRVKENEKQLTDNQVAEMVEYVQKQIADEQIDSMDKKSVYPFAWIKIAASII